MVRRRKAGASAAGAKKKGSGAPKVNKADARINKWDKPEDIPQDEEDLFHAGRDEILLDGSDTRYRDELEDMDDEEEVFALKGLQNDSDEDDEDGDATMDDEDDETLADDDSISVPKKSKKKSKDKAAKSDQDKAEESDDTEERWGKNKSAYYASKEKDIDSDDEETRAMEEAEVRRLQAKARDLVTEDDFGLDDIAAVPEEETEDIDSAAAATTSTILPTANDPKSLLRHLERTSPETLALAREWEDVAHDIYRAEAAMKAATEEDHPRLGMMHLHQQTLLAYAATLSYYLYVRAIPVPNANPSTPTTAHPVPPAVLERLFQLKQNLEILRDIGFSSLDSDASDDDDDDDDSDPYDLEDLEDEDLEGSDEDTEKNEPASKKKHRLSQAEMRAILAELQDGKYRDDDEDDSASDPASDPESTVTKPKTKAKSKAKSKSKDPTPSSSSKKKLAQSKKPTTPQFDLVEPSFHAASSKKSGSSSALSSSTAADAFVEPTSLDFASSADKKARAKSLRFHTSRIESVSKKREGARNRAMGGDDDIPWKDTRREKAAKDLEKAIKEREKERIHGGGDLEVEGDAGDAEGEASGKGKGKRSRDDDGEGEGEDGYYELVKKRKKEEKEEKKAAYEAERAANRPDVGDGSANGSRTASRAILKNRGMTPRRSKAVRNPRVKKKLKFDEAKKKMRSKQATFKGGMAALEGGRYEGEASGISTVVKSRRF